MSPTYYKAPMMYHSGFVHFSRTLKTSIHSKTININFLVNNAEKVMKEQNSDEKKTTNTHSSLGLILLVLAFIFLFAAPTLRGIESQLGTRIVLIIIGAGLTFLGGAIVLLNKLAG
jgi:hypothetical protein